MVQEPGQQQGPVAPATWHLVAPRGPVVVPSQVGPPHGVQEQVRHHFPDQVGEPNNASDGEEVKHNKRI